MNKAELILALQEEEQNWQALLDEIDVERMDQPGVAGYWSMKDIVAHLTGWDRWLVTRLQAVLRGGPEPLPPWPAHLQADDEINAWIYESNRGRSVGDVLEEAHQGLQQLLTVVASLPEDIRIERMEPAFYVVWVGEQRFPVSEFFGHFRDDHEPDVRAWLKQVEKQ